MPFVKKTENGNLHTARETHKIFVGRAQELLFFTEQVLQPDDPTYNIISICGDGGVGKSTLLQRFVEEAATPQYSEYCLTALVNERQTTAATMLDKFAEQLHLAGNFKRAQTRYRDALRKLNTQQESIPDAVLQHAPDFAGAAVEGVPIFGPLLREGLKVTATQMLKEFNSEQERQNFERLSNPLEDLTNAFITELNRQADALVTLGTQRRKRQHRIVLIFDTFERLAPEVAPWLLDYFLNKEISSNVVLITAGRIALAESLPDDRKRWLPYTDSDLIHNITLDSFSEEETRIYLEQRGITRPERIDHIWQLSHGLPLYLSLLTANAHHEIDPTADVVENFLHWIPEQEVLKRRLILDASLFSRPFNQDDLSALTYIPEQEQASLYRWLIKQPFVRRNPQNGRHSYHPLAQDLFSRHLYQSTPTLCHGTRRMLAGYYKECLERLQAHSGKESYLEPEWLELHLALTEQLLLLPESSQHIEALEELLNVSNLTKQTEGIERILRDVSNEAQENQASQHARVSAQALLQYLEAEPMSEELLLAATGLLDTIGEESFSPMLKAQIYGKRGVIERNLRRYPQALADFDQAIELDPSYYWAYGNRGITRRFMQHDEQAIQDFNKALALNDSQDWIYAARGEAYRHLKEYDKALADFSQAITLDPDYAQAYASRARIYRLLKQPKQALNDLERAIALDPEPAWFYAQRGEVLRVLKQYERALADYGQAIERDPNYFWAYGSRGLLHFLLREYAQAIADFDQSIRLNPAYAWGYAQRGRVYRHMREYKRAQADLDIAIQLDARDAWAYSHRGLLYDSLGQHERAIADFDQAIALDDRQARFYGRRAGAYLALNKIEQAKADYEHNCTLWTKDIRACWMQTWTTLCIEPLQEQQRTSYRERLERTAIIDPQHYIAYVSRGVALWLQEEHTKAQAQLLEAQQMRPNMWDAFFWHGLILCEQGDHEGLAKIKQALKLQMPAVLLAPLAQVAQKQPEFYRHHLASLLS